jgi:hypothetical protein
MGEAFKNCVENEDLRNLVSKCKVEKDYFENLGVNGTIVNNQS